MLPHLYVHYDDGAVSHLFQVAAGLDSMAVGEGQILGQTREALRLGQELGTVGPALNSLFQQALRVGKRTRAETDIDRAAPSLVATALDAVGSVEGKRVVVVGAGFAGLAATRTLAKGGALVTLVDRNPYATFQPLLYQVATAGMGTSDVSYPIRTFAAKWPNVRARRATLSKVLPDKRRVELADGSALDYDYLVLATGVTTNWLGVPGAPENGLPIYSLGDAANLRRRLAQYLEDTAAGRRESVHVVVVGAGAAGIALVEEIRRRDVEVVVVEADLDNRFRARLRDADVPVIFGDATVAETLTGVRVDQARAVAVTTSDDLVNIETGLAVRDVLGERTASVQVVLRLFDPRLAQTVAGAYDFGHALSPAALAAPWFVGAVLGLDIRDTFYVSGLPMLHARLEVPQDSALDGVLVSEMPARLRVIVIARPDGAVVELPRRDVRLLAGDDVHLVGPYDELLRLLRTAAR